MRGEEDRARRWGRPARHPHAEATCKARRLPSRSSRTSRRKSGRGTALLVVEDAGVRTVRAEPGGGRCFEYRPGGR